MSFTLTPCVQDLSGGHIPNTTTPVWFESARMPLITHVESLCQPGARFGIVRHASYDYQRELYADSEVTIETSITRMGTSSVVCSQQAWQSGQLAVLAEIVLVLMDSEQGTAVPLPEPARTYLAGLSGADSAI